MMKPYDPKKPISMLIFQLEDGWDFTRVGNQIIENSKLVSKGITLLANTAVYHEGIREWRHKLAVNKTWDNFKMHFQHEHQELRKAVMTKG